MKLLQVTVDTFLAICLAILLMGNANASGWTDSNPVYRPYDEGEEVVAGLAGYVVGLVGGSIVVDKYLRTIPIGQTMTGQVIKAAPFGKAFITIVGGAVIGTAAGIAIYRATRGDPPPALKTF